MEVLNLVWMVRSRAPEPRFLIWPQH